MSDQHEFVRGYRRTLQTDRRALLEQFRFDHLARKVVGVGSVGTRAWIALFMAPTANGVSDAIRSEEAFGGWVGFELVIGGGFHIQLAVDAGGIFFTGGLDTGLAGGLGWGGYAAYTTSPSDDVLVLQGGTATAISSPVGGGEASILTDGTTTTIQGSVAAPSPEIGARSGLVGTVGIQWGPAGYAAVLGFLNSSYVSGFMKSVYDYWQFTTKGPFSP